MSAFETWSAFLGPIEGGLSLDVSDPGNWTGGEPGVGECKGTKFGIAANSHPDIDIASLTEADAVRIRKEEYWDKVRGDELPPPLAIMLADAAYGSGPGRAIEQLQGVLGVTQDGVIGPQTMTAIQSRIAHGGLDGLLGEFAAQRLMFEAGLPIWQRYKLGWTRRLFQSILLAHTVGAAPDHVVERPAGSVARELARIGAELDALRAQLREIESEQA
jgi:lysozyme family protein